MVESIFLNTYDVYIMLNNILSAQVTGLLCLKY